ncbi:hypothetical protein AB6A40_006172 [Gnathostoma spinigerum]|uniref:BPTI/Kunitz inhibitor domain-containing protein n=1 Tax=Gnathostoma spinigerum TaxID=75299 RepID=A0ABD6EHM0_9BILA
MVGTRKGRECSRMALRVLILVILIVETFAFPDDLDSVLALLFDTTECEEFVSDATYLSVGTKQCSPHTCDFPRQLCMRKAEWYKDEKANECRNIPEECLTAANGGISLGTAATKPLTSSLTTTTDSTSATLTSSLIHPTMEGTRKESEGDGSGGLKETRPDEVNTAKSMETESPQMTTAHVAVTAATVNREDLDLLSKVHPTEVNICEMEPAKGYHCGFRVMVAYNKETRNCEKFWFPGCRNELTNANLFNSEEECWKATEICRGGLTSRPIDRPAISRPGPDLITIERENMGHTVIPRWRNTVYPRRTVPPVHPLPEFPYINGYGRPDERGERLNMHRRPNNFGEGHVNERQTNTNPNMALVGLISKTISQFTGGVDGNEEGSGLLNTFNFANIPNILQGLFHR